MKSSEQDFDSFPAAKSCFINPHRIFHGVWLPQWLEERAEVSEKAKKLYAYLTYFAGGKGYAWPSFKHLGEKLHVSRRYVIELVKELSAHRLIIVTNVHNPVERSFKAVLKRPHPKWNMCSGQLRVAARLEPHDRHQRARKGVGRNHGENDCFGQGNKEIACYPAQQKHRHKDDAEAKGGNHCRQSDFTRTLEDPVLESLASRKMAFDVFDSHRGVIDQNADRKR